MTNDPEPLSAAEALAKAEEARDMIPRGATQPQRVMLQHIAETWERIAKSASDTKH